MTRARVIAEEKAAEEAFQAEGEAAKAEDASPELPPKSELELLKEAVEVLRVRVNQLSATDGLDPIH